MPHRILNCLILLLSCVLIPGIVFAETLSDAREISAGVIQAVGVVGRDGQWRVLLKDHSTGETRLLREGQTAFGYQVKGMTWESVVLEAAGKAFILRVGQYGSAAGPLQLSHLPSVSEDLLNSPIPDLARMGNADRQVWITQWREAISALTPEDQMATREQMRDYWREQWEGRWGDVIRRMAPQEQESVRREISSYWRW